MKDASKCVIKPSEIPESCSDQAQSLRKERPLHEAEVKMKTELPWRCQDHGTSTEKSCRHGVKLAQKRGQICLDGRAREAGWPMAVGTQIIPS